jgi:hypothetical protein
MLPSGPGKLVPQTLDQAAPAGIEDAARQAAIRSHHAQRVQLFDHYGAVTLGVGVAKGLNHVLALPGHLTVQPGHAELGFVPVARSHLATRHRALRTSKSCEGSLAEARRLDETTIGVRNDVDCPAVRRNKGDRSRGGRRDLALTKDRSKPLVALATQGARLWFPCEGPRQHGAEVGKSQQFAVEPPRLWVGLSEPKKVTPLALPVGLPTDALEAVLPSYVQLDKQLCAEGDRFAPACKSLQ